LERNYETSEVDYGTMFVKDVLRKCELIFQNKDYFSNQLIFKINGIFICVLIIKTLTGIKFALLLSKSIESIIGTSYYPKFFFPKYFQKNLKLCLDMMKVSENFSMR